MRHWERDIWGMGRESERTREFLWEGNGESKIMGKVKRVRRELHGGKQGLKQYRA